ncbi:MAG: hypothetical protein ACD_19C00182G0091 [uncultured bacterium]|nr:MAG: hypothetical protein ACD_19C00182G0091 [uncultured bacterium]
MQMFNGNYIDLVIILILFFFALNTLRYGFWILFVDFMSFFGSLTISLWFYKYVSEFLKVNFSLSSSVSNALGFLLSAIIIESLLGYLFGILLHKLPEKLIKHKLNKLLGLTPALGEGVVLVSFLLTLLTSLPIKPQVKLDVEDSKIGNYLLNKTVIIEKYLNQIFGGVINDSLTYLTVNPESKESIPLEVKKTELKIDEKSESQMFAKVNEERRKLAITELVWEPNLVPIARNHAKDMWERKYFSHYSPEGKDVGDRLNAEKIKFGFAGENLALAPTVQTAHTGLMNSDGHRKNILEPRFKKIGIGVIDNGVYGKMFVQVFTD